MDLRLKSQFEVLYQELKKEIERVGQEMGKTKDASRYSQLEDRLYELKKLRAVFGTVERGNEEHIARRIPFSRALIVKVLELLSRTGSILGIAPPPLPPPPPPRAPPGGPPGGPPPPPPPSEEKEEEKEACPICLEDLEDGSPIHIGPCTHRMHNRCYARLPPAWTHGPKTGQKACPVCRYNAVVPGQLREPLRSQAGYGKPRKCRKCDLPKLRGGVAPDRKAYFDLVKQSYEPSASKKVGDWELVAETPTLKFYKSGNDVVVSIRGTFDSRDTKADATIAVNSLHLSDRFKEDERFLSNFKQQNPDLKYYGVGHSLGGAILDLFLHKGLISEGQSYNPAIQPHDFGATLPNHRIFMSGDPLYTLVRLFLKQKPEVIKENSSIFRKIVRLTPIGNIATAGEYLKSHGLDHFEGKGKFSKLNEALSKKKIMEKKLFDDRVELQSLQLNFGAIDPEDDVEREIAREEIESVQTGIERSNAQLSRINGKIRNYYEDGTHNPVHVRPTAKPLPGPSTLRNGQGKSALTLHAVIVKKPYDLQEARALARDIMKSKKDKFMRETSTSYRFRNVPKTKFSSFVTKVLNPQVSLVFGNLKN